MNGGAAPPDTPRRRPPVRAATLIKAQPLLVIPLIFGVALLGDANNIRSILIAATKAGVVILTALLVVMPWSYRNHTVFGEWVMVSTNGGLTLLTGNNAERPRRLHTRRPSGHEHHADGGEPA